MAHRVFIVFLVMVGCTSALAVGIHGWSYYWTPLVDRPFVPEYAEMKPSGLYTHGLGILGASMIIAGVALYSTRKRMRALWNLGRLSSWLEFHIFLCLLGPVLVVYHTTFKAGGIAAISLWTMLSVVASGVIGRFLYVLIPRTLKGGEMTARQINEEFDRVSVALRASELGNQILDDLDRQLTKVQRPETLSETVRAYIQLMRAKRQVAKRLGVLLAQSHLPAEASRNLYKAAMARASLIQRSVVLLQAEKLFYYWHVIHLPFAGIMFLTLAVHVGVALWLGYRWIF